MQIRPSFLFAVILGAGLANFHPAHAVDLLQSYRQALDQDATYQAARAEAAATREVLPQARAQLMPNLSASLVRGKNQTDSTTPGLFSPQHNSYEYLSSNYNLILRQPLYRKYSFALYQQAEYQVAGAEAALDKSLQDLLVRLCSTYFEALMASDTLALVQSQKEAYSSQLQAAKRSFAAGQGTRTDIDDAQARYDMILAQELVARQDFSYTRRQIEVITNSPTGELAVLDPLRMELIGPVPDKAEEWISRGEEVNAELRAMHANVEAARKEVEKARAGHMPTVDFYLQRGKSDSENNTSINAHYLTSQAGLQINIPLFAGGQVVSQARQALANLDKYRQQHEARRREIGEQIRKEFQNVTEGVFKVRALEQAERSADQAVFSNQKGFQAGVRSQVDILNAQQQRMTARRDLAQARYMYVVARIKLQALVGSLGEDEIQRVNSWLTTKGASSNFGLVSGRESQDYLVSDMLRSSRTLP